MALHRKSMREKRWIISTTVPTYLQIAKWKLSNVLIDRVEHLSWAEAARCTDVRNAASTTTDEFTTRIFPKRIWCPSQRSTVCSVWKWSVWKETTQEVSDVLPIGRAQCSCVGRSVGRRRGVLSRTSSWFELSALCVSTLLNTTLLSCRTMPMMHSMPNCQVVDEEFVVQALHKVLFSNLVCEKWRWSSR